MCVSLGTDNSRISGRVLTGGLDYRVERHPRNTLLSKGHSNWIFSVPLSPSQRTGARIDRVVPGWNDDRKTDQEVATCQPPPTVRFPRLRSEMNVPVFG